LAGRRGILSLISHASVRRPHGTGLAFSGDGGKGENPLSRRRFKGFRELASA